MICATTGNRLLSAGGTSFTYDSLGNTLTAGQWTYSWGGNGKMAKAEKPGLIVEFKYDPFGRRIEKKTTTGGVPVTFTYVYDGDDIAAQVSGAAVTHFIHGQGTDEHLALSDGSESFYYLQDGLGSVTRLTNSAQTVVQSYSYDTFGNSTASGSVDQPYRFTGREFDSETGLNYHHARYLDTSVGRWLSRDPIGFAAGDVNLYGYVGNNAVNYTDPSGLFQSHWALRAIVPGQAAWDSAVTAFENGSYGLGGVNLLAMIGEQTLFAASFGQGAAVKQSGLCSVTKGPVVIGETMERVEFAASKISGAKILNDMPDYNSMGLKPHEVTSSMMQYNRKWILEQLRSGRKIIDLGLDPNRKRPSIFYQMEQQMIKNYKTIAK